MLMKSSLVLLLAMTLVLGFASCASASFSVQVGVPVGSEYYEDGYGTTAATGFALGIEAMLGDSFKLGLDYLSENDTYYHNLGIKGGYRLLNNDAFQLDVFAAYHMFDLYTPPSDNGNYVALGADAAFSLSDSLSIGASVEYAVSGSFTWGSDVCDLKVFGYALNVTYLFTENWGVSVGYSYINFDLPGTSWNPCGFKGFTASAIYSF